MTALQGILSPAAVDAVGWTLLHSLWQGIGVAGLLVAALVVLRRRAAHRAVLAVFRRQALCVMLPVGRPRATGETPSSPGV